jgi:hypothetical protein
MSFIQLKPYQAGCSPLPQMKFAGIKEFAVKLGVSEAQVTENLGDFFAGANLLPVLQAATPATRKALLADVRKLQTSLPLGTVTRENGNVVITNLDTKTGEPEVTSFPESARPVVAGPEVSMKDFMKQALGEDPKVVICPVGWTAPSPQVLAQNNPKFAEQLARLTETVTAEFGKDNPDLPKKIDKASKLLAGAVYERAFKLFWEPIDQYLFEERKLDPSKFAFLTSASYDGIDRAAMDYASSKNMPVVNVTPFAYANWMKTDLPFPLKVSNTIDDYARDCAEGAGMLVVTGGRDHAWSKDVDNFLIKEKKLVVPADILSEALAMDVPATKDGAVDNAARLLNEMGVSVGTGKYAKNVRSSGKLTAFQQEVAGAIETLYNQTTCANNDAIIAELTKKK